MAIEHSVNLAEVFAWPKQCFGQAIHHGQSGSLDQVQTAAFCMLHLVRHSGYANGSLIRQKHMLVNAGLF